MNGKVSGNRLPKRARQWVRDDPAADTGSRILPWSSVQESQMIHCMIGKDEKDELTKAFVKSYRTGIHITTRKAKIFKPYHVLAYLLTTVKRRSQSLSLLFQTCPSSQNYGLPAPRSAKILPKGALKEPFTFLFRTTSAKGRMKAICCFRWREPQHGTDYWLRSRQRCGTFLVIPYGNIAAAIWWVHRKLAFFFWFAERWPSR